MNEGGFGMARQLWLFTPDEQFLGEELRKEPAGEKRPLRWRAFFMFSASLALWAIIIFVASRFF